MYVVLVFVRLGARVLPSPCPDFRILLVNLAPASIIALGQSPFGGWFILMRLKTSKLWLRLHVRTTARTPLPYKLL